MNEMVYMPVCCLVGKPDILHMSIFYLINLNRSFPFLSSSVACCAVLLTSRDTMSNLLNHGLMNEMDMRHCVVSSASFDIL
jgi:hypothetical protein